MGPAEADAGRGLYARAADGAAGRAGGCGRVAVAGRGTGPERSRANNGIGRRPHGRKPRRHGAKPRRHGGLEAKARAEAETARDGERKAREQLAAVEYGRTMQVAHQEWREQQRRRRLALLDSTRADLRGWEWRYVHRLCHSDLLTLKGHTGVVDSASFSPDGSRIVTGSVDKTAKVWDAKTGAEVLTLKGHTEHVLFGVVQPGRVADRDRGALTRRRRSGTRRLVPRSSHSRGTPAPSIRRRSARTGRGS